MIDNEQSIKAIDNYFEKQEQEAFQDFKFDEQIFETSEIL